MKVSDIVTKNTSFFSQSFFIPYLIEVIIALIHPNIFTRGYKFTTSTTAYHVKVTYEINDMLTLVTLFRVYVLFRGMIVLTGYYNSRAFRIARLIGSELTMMFSVKCLITDESFTLLFFFGIFSIATLTFSLKIVEGPVYTSGSGVNDFRSIENCLWNVLVTMTTVGYGDTYPKSVLGKIYAVITSLCGSCLVSILTLSLTNVTTLANFENNAYMGRFKVIINDKTKKTAVSYFIATMKCYLSKKKYKSELAKKESANKSLLDKLKQNAEKTAYEKVKRQRIFSENVQLNLNTYEAMTEFEQLKLIMDDFQAGLNDSQKNSKLVNSTVNEIIKEFA